MTEKITASKKQDPGKAIPGVSREQRISDEGLKRLEKQLQCGVNISEQVLNQWLMRYGKAARDLIEKYYDKDDKLSAE